jgi:hypothetical protein
MITRSTSHETATASTPTCWQREAPSACLRIELASGEIHLFSYQHFLTAALKPGDGGTETVRITFASHEVEIAGRGLRELLLGLQDFAVKWVRTPPARYAAAGADGMVSSIQITESGD